MVLRYFISAEIEVFGNLHAGKDLSIHHVCILMLMTSMQLPQLQVVEEYSAIRGITRDVACTLHKQQLPTHAQQLYTKHAF